MRQLELQLVIALLGHFKPYFHLPCKFVFVVLLAQVLCESTCCLAGRMTGTVPGWVLQPQTLSRLKGLGMGPMKPVGPEAPINAEIQARRPLVLTSKRFALKPTELKCPQNDELGPSTLDEQTLKARTQPAQFAGLFAESTPGKS